MGEIQMFSSNLKMKQVSNPVLGYLFHIKKKNAPLATRL